MNDDAGVEPGLIRLEAELSRPGERFALAVRPFFFDWPNQVANLEPRLAALRQSGAEIDLPSQIEQRMFGPFGGKLEQLAAWQASRAALAEAGERLAPALFERFGAAVSHTDGLAIAVARVTAASHRAAVGVDVERADRPLSDAVQRRIANPRDAAVGAPAIALWSLKEALYKTLGQGVFAEFEVQLVGRAGGLWLGQATWHGRGFRVGVAVTKGYLIAAALAGER